MQQWTRPAKNLRNAWLILFTLTLSACARVPIKNGEWCGDAGDLGASCFWTLSTETRDVEKAQWDAERHGMLCTKAENFANWKAAILKLCKLTRACSFEDVKAVEAFGARVDAWQARALLP